MKTKSYRICSRCVMDTSDIEISFDKNGFCNHCLNFEETLRTSAGTKEKKEYLAELILKIKKTGKKRKYDCIVGLSGGVDSAYVALHVKRLGLRALAVHLDNGWNSELAVKNIENIVKKLDMDFQTFVIDWEEFKQIQLAYLKASVVDIEVPTDHAIRAVLYKMAQQYNVSYILMGNNTATEQIMPRMWLGNKMDSWNLKDILARFGKAKLNTFPVMGILEKLWCQHILRIKSIDLLEFIDYKKNEAREVLARELGWRDYGGKHYESLFTKFYQAYILPQKFKIDKRRAHLSCLICSGQMARQDALAELERDLYPQEELRVEKPYVLKKLGLTDAEFQALMELPPRRHEDFLTEDFLWRFYYGICSRTKQVRLLIQNMSNAS